MYSYTGCRNNDLDCGPLLCIIDNGPGYKMRTKITIIRLKRKKTTRATSFVVY